MRRLLKNKSPLLIPSQGSAHRKPRTTNVCFAHSTVDRRRRSRHRRIRDDVCCRASDGDERYSGDWIDCERRFLSDRQLDSVTDSVQAPLLIVTDDVGRLPPVTPCRFGHSE